MFLRTFGHAPLDLTSQRQISQSDGMVGLHKMDNLSPPNQAETAYAIFFSLIDYQDRNSFISQ